MTQKFKKLLAWAKTNERHISSVVFVGGFLTDLATFAFASITRADELFLIYLIVVIVFAVGAHYVFVHGYGERKKLMPRVLNVLFPLVSEFFIGALLSGFLIFYTKSAAIFVSWPFLLLLFIVFVGNELFRSYREHLAFQVGLIFFCIYAYTIFALPLAVGTLGPLIFIGSGLLAIGILLIYLFILAKIGAKRLKESRLLIILVTSGLLFFVNISYFTGVLPPLPLTLSDAGAYQSVQHVGDSYVLMGELSKPWWDIFQPTIVHLTPNESLSVYSAVFAPVSFSTTVVHKWEVYNDSKHAWTTRAEIAFVMSGGREEGYRGYSTLTNVQPGKYRVSIETMSGQVIGRRTFTVVQVTQQPVLEAITK